MRNKVLYRQWQMLHAIYNHRNRGISKDQLAFDFEVSKKTIERDIECLSTAGFPIFDKKFSYENNKIKYFMNPNYIIPSIRLSLLESYVLYVLMKVSSPLKGYFDLAVEDSFGKIYSQAPKEFTEFARSFSSIIIPDLSSSIILTEENHKTLTLIIQAILKNKQIHFKYKSIFSNKIKEHTISPLCIKFHRNNFYLAGHLKRKAQTLIFALNRIFDIEISDKEQDQVPFDPESFFDDAFGISQGVKFNVELKFSPEINQYICERIWHKKQKIKILEDKSVVLKMPAKSMYETVRFVLSFADKVEVLEPENLRENVKLISNKIYKIYSS